MPALAVSKHTNKTDLVYFLLVYSFVIVISPVQDDTTVTVYQGGAEIISAFTVSRGQVYSFIGEYNGQSKRDIHADDEDEMKLETLWQTEHEAIKKRVKRWWRGRNSSGLCLEICLVFSI